MYVLYIIYVNRIIYVNILYYKHHKIIKKSVYKYTKNLSLSVSTPTL